MIVVTVVMALIGASIGGAWLMGRNSADNSSASTERFTGPPNQGPEEVWATVGSVLGSSGAIDPYQGFSLEDDDGTSYIYDDSRWTAVTPDGSIWVVPEATAELIEEQGRILIAGGDDDSRWVEELLADAPGIERDGDGFVVTDTAIYRDGIIEVASEAGVMTDTTKSGVTRVIRPPVTELGYVYGEDDHAWIVTESGAALVIADADSLVVAGSIVAGSLADLDVAAFEPRPGYDTPFVRDILLGGKFGTYKTNVPSAADGIDGCRTLDEIYADSPVDSDGFAPSDLAEACENQPSELAASSERDRIDQAWARVTIEKRKAGEKSFGCSWWVLDCVKSTIVATPTLIESGYHATVGKVDDYTVCVVGDMICPDWYWEKLEGLWDEHSCGSPGPGTGSNGKGAPIFDTSRYSVANVAAEAGYNPTEAAFAIDRLALARAWMPRIELSNDELCGEIVRIVARVHPYAPGGTVATNLREADRVEIVYTIFFREDGGRFGRATHVGDNEGFVIALTRRASSSGQCRGTDFELLAGRGVGHKDAEGWFEEFFEITEREIDDFSPGKSRGSGDRPITSSCPELGPEGGFFLHSAESKHATYYDRDKCEAALVPASPALLAAFVLGFAAGGVAGGALSATMVQAVLKTMPDGLSPNDGMEECELGRTPYDLSDRVELYDDAFADVAGFDAHRSGDPNHAARGGGDDHSFGAGARGKWCPVDLWSVSRAGKTCLDDDFHVPGFFEASAAFRAATNDVGIQHNDKHNNDKHNNDDDDNGPESQRSTTAATTATIIGRRGVCWSDISTGYYVVVGFNHGRWRSWQYAPHWRRSTAVHRVGASVG